MKSSRIPAVFLTLSAGLVISLAAGSMVGGAQQPTGRIATIDIVLIVNEYQRQKDLTEEMNKLQQTLKSESVARTQRVDALVRELNAFDPADPRSKQKSQDLLKMQIDNKNWIEFKQAMMTGEVAVWTHFIYKEIAEAAARIAQERGIDAVFYRDEFPPVIRDPQEIRNIIRQRKLIYANPAIDISQEVLHALDAAYRAKPAKQMINLPM